MAVLGSATMEQTSASAEGGIARIPFAHLLVYALDKRLSGALFLTQADGVEHAVRFVCGAPVKVRAGDRYSLLGEMLVEAGAIDSATLAQALGAHGLLGDVLLLAERIDRGTLERIAREQFARRMARLFELPTDTTFRYYDGHTGLDNYGGDPAMVDPLETLWSGLRLHGDVSTGMAGALSWLGDTPLRLHASSTVARFGLRDQENDLLDLLQAHPATCAELVGLELAPPALTRRFVYALSLTRQLDFGHGASPVGAADSARNPSSSSPPSSGRNVAGQTAVARLQLRSTVHRVGAAAPDLPGDGERRTSLSPGNQRRKAQPPVAESASEPPHAPDSDPAPISAVTPMPGAHPPVLPDAPATPPPTERSFGGSEVAISLSIGERQAVDHDGGGRKRLRPFGSQ